MAERQVQYQNIRFVSKLPHDSELLSRLGFRQDGASVGSVSSAFDMVTEEEALAEFAEFLERHEGQDWVMRAEMVGFIDPQVEITASQLKKKLGKDAK